MRILVTYGSKRGGTAGIARAVAAVLTEAGHDAEVTPVESTPDVDAYDAVIVGGSVYGDHWNAAARRFVATRREGLAAKPVWLFSSGPLDDSASRGFVPPVAQVLRLLQEIDARGHETFGGRLEPDVTGWRAAAKARRESGDWRDPAHIRRWALQVSAELERVFA